MMRQALQAAKAFGFRRIQLGVLADNALAIALYRKLGFIEEGIRREMLLIDGVYIDEIMMARLCK